MQNRFDLFEIKFGSFGFDFFQAKTPFKISTFSQMNQNFWFSAINPALFEIHVPI